MNKIFALILCAALCAPITLLAAQGDCNETSSASAGAMFMDLILVRPLGLVGTAVGAVVFVGTLPFSILGGNVGEAGKKLVVEPVAFTFIRPVGKSARCR